MMPRERILFLKAERTQARNGEQLTEWVPASKELTNVPTERRKRKSSDNIVINAGEEFVDLKLVFWVRFHSTINENLRIIYEGKTYRILDIDRKFHNNSCEITCIKINA